MILYLVGFIVFLCILHLLLNYNERARMIKKIPGPKLDFIFGNGLRPAISSETLMSVARKFAKTWNGIYSVWMYPFGAVIIYNPEDIETILSQIKYGEKSIVYSFLKPWLGDGLLISSGAKWQERRKILTPAFHFTILKDFFQIIEENSELFVKHLMVTVDQPVDVLSVLSEFTLNTICETAMGTNLSEDATGAGKSYRNAIYNLGTIISYRFARVLLYPQLIFDLSPWGKKQRKNLTTVHNLTKSVIDKRKDFVQRNGINTALLSIDDDEDLQVYKKKKKFAMLDLLILAEKDGLIDNAGIQEEVDTFMFEGHDTTASGLTFCLMIIANHRNVQKKIQKELTDLFGDTKGRIKMEDLNKMKYMECCIKESLRLYPPVHFISRKLNETTILSNYTVPAGTLCHIPIVDVHRLERIYENPDKFDPDRFLSENSIGRHPYAYIPFSAGPRNCVGQKFAMMEMKIALAKILRDFDLEPITRPEDIRFTDDIILRHDEPVFVKFVKRE